MIVVFDLDGTLVDSASDITSALGDALALRGLSRPGLDEVRGWIGDGARTLVARALRSRGVEGEGEIDACHLAFRAQYERVPVVDTRPYDGVVGLLGELRDAGHRVAVCTNKPAAPMWRVLEGAGLLPFVDAAVGGDELAVRKPDPAHLLEAVRRAGGGPAVMVGDGPADRDAARAAGVPFVWVSWGYGGEDVGAGAHRVCRDAAALREAVLPR